MAWRPSNATVSVAAIAVALAGNMATSTVSVKAGWWPVVVWTAVGVLATSAVAMELLRQRGPSPADGRDLAPVVDELAAVVRKQWRDEVARRALNDPYPLPVRWEPAPADDVAGWGDVTQLAANGAGWPRTGREGWAATPEGLAGTGGELVEVWRKVPTRRLVVLGDPGSGKTMLLARLVIDLLDPAVRAAGDPVPVLVSLASWHPVDQDLLSWLVEQLVIDHPALDRKHARGGPLARALLDNGSITLVLDGLDEIPEGLRAQAVVAINQALHSGQPLIVSSRTDAYSEAIRPAGGIGVALTGAAGIRLRPLDAQDVVDYLRSSAGGATGRRRWDRVADALASGGPLAEALVTPLMTTLARTVYNPTSMASTTTLPDPADLLELEDSTAVERHLLDGFVPASYRPHPTRRTRWEPDQAERWLGYLAYHLEHDRNGFPDLAWWQLHLRARPRSPSKVFAALVCGGIAVLAGAAAAALYSSAFGYNLVGVLGPAVAATVVLVFGTILWLTGRFDAAVVSVVVAGIGGGLAADLGGDFSGLAATSPSLIITVGLAAGFAHPLRSDGPRPLVAGGAVMAMTALMSAGLNAANLPALSTLDWAVTEGVLAGLIVMAAMTLSAPVDVLVTSRRDWVVAASTATALHLIAYWPDFGQGERSSLDWMNSVLSVVVVAAVGASRAGRSAPRHRVKLAVVVASVLALKVLLWDDVVTFFLVVGFIGAMGLRGAYARRGRSAVGTPEDWLTRPFRAGTGYGLVHALYFSPLYGLAVGVAVALVVELGSPLLASQTPAQGLRLTGRGAMVGVLVCAAVWLLLTGRQAVSNVLLLGLAIGGAAAVTYGLDVPRTITPVRSPEQVLAKDRMVFLVNAAAVAVAITLAVGVAAGAGSQFEPTTAAVGGLTYGLAAGAVVAFSRTQWPRYTLNRIALTAAGSVPWALTSFLRDAHTVHGVLRQNGASYQFRHVDLQRRLAERYAARLDRRHDDRSPDRVG